MRLTLTSLRGASLGAALLAATAVLAGPVAAAELTGTLQKINDRGTIVLGHRDASPPFSSAEKGKDPQGYSIDLCLRVVEAVKQRLARPDITVTWVALAAEDRIPRVVDGTVDIECGNTTHTLSRQEQVDFSLKTFITGAGLLLRADSPIQNLSDLAGKKVSVVEGTTTEKALIEQTGKALINVTIVPVKDHNDGVRRLEKGEVDAHAGDQLVLIGLARAAKDPKAFSLAPELFSYEPYALMLRRNDADFKLVVDRVLAGLYRSGQIAQVYDRWFGDWGGRPSRLLLAMYALNGLPE